MGHPKQLIVHEGQPLVARAAAAARDAGADPVVVVLGAHAGEIEPALAGLGVRVALNPEWESGLASSLTAGLRAALRDDRWDGALVTLADQPLIDAAILRSLITAFQNGARLVASGYQGLPGVPALFGREHVPELLALTGDAGAGPWLRQRLSELTIVPLDAALLDLDTPADAARLARRTGLR
jgi:CTP:molybdopterin cytidylyltransferase MocA